MSDRHREGLIAEMMKILQEHFGDNLISVVLFGSVARGNCTPGSDTDIIVVASGFPRTMGGRMEAHTPSNEA